MISNAKGGVVWREAGVTAGGPDMSIKPPDGVPTFSSDVIQMAHGAAEALNNFTATPDTTTLDIESFDAVLKRYKETPGGPGSDASFSDTAPPATTFDTYNFDSVLTHHKQTARGSGLDAADTGPGYSADLKPTLISFGTRISTGPGLVRPSSLKQVSQMPFARSTEKTHLKKLSFSKRIQGPSELKNISGPRIHPPAKPKRMSLPPKINLKPPSLKPAAMKRASLVVPSRSVQSKKQSYDRSIEENKSKGKTIDITFDW